MVKKDSESDDYYEGVKKFDCSFADFDAYMNDLDMEIESRFGPIGLGLWLGNGVKKIKRATLAQTVERMRFCYEHHMKCRVSAEMKFETMSTQKELRKKMKKDIKRFVQKTTLGEALQVVTDHFDRHPKLVRDALVDVWGKSDPAEVQALESKYAAGITREDGERMQEQDSMHDHIQGLEHMVSELTSKEAPEGEAGKLFGDQ